MFITLQEHYILSDRINRKSQGTTVNFNAKFLKEI